MLPTPFMGNHYTPAAERSLINYWDKYYRNDLSSWNVKFKVLQQKSYE